MAFPVRPIKPKSKLRFREFVILDVRFRVLVVLLIAIFIGVLVPFFIINHFDKVQGENLVPQECLLEHELRIDCLPGVPELSQSNLRCKKVGCCWEEFGPPIPNCFHSFPSNYSYNVDKTERNGDVLLLSANFETTPLGSQADQLVSVELEHSSPNHLRILIHKNFGFDPMDHLSYTKTTNETVISDRSYRVYFPNKEKFHVKVYRKESAKNSENPPIFNTFYGPMIISQGLTEVTTLLPSFDIYGIGQSPKANFRHDLKYLNKFPLFSRSDHNNETHPMIHMSAGVHPFYMVLEKDGKAHGVLLVSSFPSEITTSGAPSVTFRTTESRLDFHIFLGPTPSDVVRQLTEFVGRPAMPPYWALGYHSCRDASGVNQSLEFLGFTRSKRIPHESDCGSLSITSSAFTLDPIMSSNFTSFVNTLTSTERKLILFMSPHVLVAVDENINGINYKPYKDAMQMGQDIFVKNPVTKSPFLGFLADGTEVVYPDLFRTTTIVKWLEKQFKAFVRNVTFDGLFLDLNTPLNFNVSKTNTVYCKESTNAFEFSSIARNLGDGTICMDALHVNNHPHIYLHNIYGYKHMVVVKDALQSLKKFQNKRLFLSSLSTFTGSGAQGGHWGGLVRATWDTLKQSVIQMMDFSLFGIPLYGVPVCGSSGPINQDLCSRWLQVAAFQPLMLTHRIDDQELLHYHRRLTPVGRSMIQLRYSLLPYLYSLFYNASQYGDTVIRPLFFEFPTVPETYKIDQQFMWGGGLLVSPVLKPSTQRIKAFFPPGCWYDYYTGKMEYDSSIGKYKELIAIEYQVNLHIRGGHVIPRQEKGLTTAESRRLGFTLTIALNCLRRESGKGRVIDTDKILAYGELFIDDGQSSKNIEKGNFLLVEITLKGQRLTIESKPDNTTKRSFQKDPNVSTTLSAIHIYGIPEKPTRFVINGDRNNHIYNSVLESVILADLELDLIKNHVIQWFSN